VRGRGGVQFAAIDVETANADMASVCQIGIVHFAAGSVSEEWKTYVDPEDYFDELNVSIHGIDANVVAGAPTFCEIADRIYSRLESQVVVTHSAFDRVAVYQAATRGKISPPNCTWLDSARVARRAWLNLAHSGYGLANVCKHIGYTFRHHDALEDAKAAGQIIIAAITETGLDISGWLKRVRQPLDPTKTDEKITRQGNPDGQLYDEVIVFTGALQIVRREAADIAAKIGCRVDAGVTERTTLLVVGDQDVRLLAGHTRSRKHRKAEELIRKGQNIRILRESDFLELVQLSN
jgi:DNA polymerase III subunit epsilon